MQCQMNGVMETFNKKKQNRKMQFYFYNFRVLSNFFFQTVLSHKQLYANILWKRCNFHPKIITRTQSFSICLC